MFEKEAEEYAIENWEYYEEGQNDSKALKQAYLAGAEFGYNKANEWHKVADGDYPPCERSNYYSVNVLTDCGNIAYYNYTLECWVVEYASVEIDPPIAWCDIPKYTDKE